MRRVEEVARCTHLVVENRVVRTEKFLCAMAYGVPVVTRQWIIDSIAQGKALRKQFWSFSVTSCTYDHHQQPTIINSQGIRSSRRRLAARSMKPFGMQK